MTLQEEITRRRTFAVIAHPDAGKTTLTEKLLLFGGAIHVAGAVKSNKIKKGATSDFMEIERQRGISVATSVMGFNYKDVKINILDTPGHEDFAEDTYRTLSAVDSVIIVIDGNKGTISVEKAPLEHMDAHLMGEELTAMYADNENDRKHVAVVCAGGAAEHCNISMLNFTFYDPNRGVVRLKQAGRGGIGRVFRHKKIKAVVCKYQGIHNNLNQVHDISIINKSIESNRCTFIIYIFN